MTRAVIPIGPKRAPTLIHAVRSLDAHAGITELVTVGARPEGIEPDYHIESPNDKAAHKNVCGHLRRVCEAFGGEFVWTDDDTFTIKPWTPGVYVRGYSIAQMLRKYPNRSTWSQSVRNAIQVMKAQGYDPETVPCGTIHRPWLVDAERALQTLDALDEVGGGSFRSLYVAGMDDVIPAADPKVSGRAMPPAHRDVVSLDGKSAWTKNAGRLMREQFRFPSGWEHVSVPSGGAEAQKTA